MEVHAHTHTADPDSHRGRKKWTHYFWEFLMLFLAVFCGFLAEYQLEHTIEHQREKKFVQSLISDVEADTARLNSIINSRTLRDTRVDSIFYLLNSDSAEQNSKTIYNYSPDITRVTIIQFTPNDGTVQQLKNAGGLRLIRKRWVADSIVRYDVAARSLMKLSDQEADGLQMYRATVWRVINSAQLLKMTDEENLPVRIDYNPPLESGYKQILNEFNYRLLTVKNINKGYRRESRKLLRQATNLLITLKKEYHLE